MLFPLYHPAAALYTPSMLQALEDDFARLPALLGRAGAAVRRPTERPVEAPSPLVADDVVAVGTTTQLGLF